MQKVAVIFFLPLFLLGNQTLSHCKFFCHSARIPSPKNKLTTGCSLQVSPNLSIHAGENAVKFGISTGKRRCFERFACSHAGRRVVLAGSEKQARRHRSVNFPHYLIAATVWWSTNRKLDWWVLHKSLLFFSVALAPLTLLQSLANVGRRRSVHDPYRANLETCLEGGKHLLLTRAMYPDMHRSFCFFFLPS